jgi:hypothetical protein
MLRRMAPIAAVAALAVVVPVVLAATPAHVLPTQRIDVKVLLVSADGTEPGFGAWKAELQREGVPYSTFVAYNGQNRVSTLTDEGLADYGANHAYYDAVILATGDLGHNVANANGTTSYLSALSDTEWASLAKFERTFGIRQLSDYTAPSPAHGLNVVGGATQDGNVGTLTPLGRAAFPYLKGPVPIANDDPAVAETFGYAATPVNGQDWQTLLAGPNGTAYLGIYTHPDDGREEMVMTVASNENQSQAQLLRHGELNWVTRGVFLGYQRNYLELQVDDLFLGDDAWDPATHTTSYDPARASRMTAADVAQAAAWSKARGVRIDFAFNGGGSELDKADHATTSDPPAAGLPGQRLGLGHREGRDQDADRARRLSVHGQSRDRRAARVEQGRQATGQAQDGRRDGDGQAGRQDGQARLRPARRRRGSGPGRLLDRRSSAVHRRVRGACRPARRAGLHHRHADADLHPRVDRLVHGRRRLALARRRRRERQPLGHVDRERRRHRAVPPRRGAPARAVDMGPDLDPHRSGHRRHRRLRDRLLGRRQARVPLAVRQRRDDGRGGGGRGEPVLRLPVTLALAALAAVRGVQSITEGKRSSGGRRACRSARVGGARPEGRGVPAEFERVSQHLPRAARGGGRY